MDIILPDIIAEFRKYSQFHPLRVISDVFFDDKGSPILKYIATDSWAFNTINAVGRALQLLARIDEKAYYDMVQNKIKEKDKDSWNMHNLVSAFCELSIMNTFIVRSSDPNSFKYEDRVNPDNKKNVEFSINMDCYTFHVEVKSPNLILEDQKIAEALQDNDKVIITDARINDIETLKENVNAPVRYSLDMKIADFLKDANKKFCHTDDRNEINLLIICWDDRLQVPLMALKSRIAQGLLTSESFLKDEEGNSLIYPNVECIIVNDQYEFFKRYVSYILFENFSPQYPVDPFFQVFANNFIIDQNLTDDRCLMFRSILQQNSPVCTEEFADTMRPLSVATMKKEEDHTIKFREFIMAKKK